MIRSAESGPKGIAADSRRLTGSIRPNCEGTPEHWDSVARVEELSKNHSFLVAFVNSKLPGNVRRQFGASDVVQSVLFSASQNAHAFLGTSEREFLSWIFEIARNRIIDGIRRFQTYEKNIALHIENSLCDTGETIDDQTPSRRMRVEEDAATLIRAIESVPSDMRQLVLLRYSRGLTFEQIGIELKTPVTTCRRHWLSACKLLQQQLKQMVS